MPRLWNIDKPETGKSPRHSALPSLYNLLLVLHSIKYNCKWIKLYAVVLKKKKRKKKVIIGKLLRYEGLNNLSSAIIR